MPGNGRVFISHVHEDNARAQPLLAALDAWGMDYWFDTQQLDPGNQISERVQRALLERDVFLLIATGATNRSLWTGLETQAYRGLMERDRQARRGGRREVIYLMLDRDFQRPQLQPGERLVDATGNPRVWLKELRSALGVKPPVRALSRRTVIAAGGVAVVALAVSATAGGFALVARENKRPSPVIPTTHQPTSTPLEGADRLRWFFATESGAGALGIAGSAVYLGGELDGLFALDAGSGSVKWHNVRLNAVIGPALLLPVVGDVIYLPTSAAGGATTLAAVNTADGTVRWNVPLGADTFDVSAPRVTSSAVYVTANDGYTYAIKVADGALLWKTKIADKNSDHPPAPAVLGNLIVVGSDDGNLYALDALSGTIRWRYQTIGKIQSSPAAANGIVYVGSSDKSIHAVDVTLGTPRWKVKTDGEVNSSPTVANGVVYVGSQDTYLYALHATTGTQVWRTQAGVPAVSGFVNGDFIDTQPALSADTVYVTAGAFLYAFDLSTGKLRWHYATIDLSPGSSPVVANGVVYFCGGSDSHALFAVTA